MNNLNIEEYEKVKKPESYIVKYKNVCGFKHTAFTMGGLFTKDVVISFITKEEAEDYAKKIKYAQKFLGDDLGEMYGSVTVSSFEEQFE